MIQGERVQNLAEALADNRAALRKLRNFIIKIQRTNK